MDAGISIILSKIMDREIVPQAPNTGGVVLSKNKIGLVGLFCFFIFALLLTGCGEEKVTKQQDSSGQPMSGGTLRYSLLDDPMSLDPANFNDELSMNVGKEIFEGLVDFDYSTKKIVPAHADKWDVKDNQIYNFYLRKGTKFQNGREVTAEDFKYSFDRLLDPKTEAMAAWIFENVKGAVDRMSGKAEDTVGIKVIDKYTLQITLEKPYNGFLFRLTHPGASVVDLDTVARAGGRFGRLGAKPEEVVGTGPFKLAQWQPKSAIKLVRNDDYYGSQAHLDGIEFRIIADETTTLNEFRAANLDLIDRIPPGQKGLVEKEFAGQTATGTIWGMEFYGFNMAKPPFNNNVKLRQALNYAIDREGIIKAVLEGAGIPAGTALPPEVPEHDNSLKGYSYDPDKAAALFVEAGYPGGQGLPEVEITYNNRETNQKIAEAVQAQWLQIGFKTVLKPLPLPDFQKEVGSGNFTIFRLGWSADYPEPDSILYPMFSSQAGNLLSYTNSKVDSLLDKAQAASAEERVALYREAERKITDDAPVVWLFHPTNFYLKAKNVQGLETNLMGLVTFNKIWISR